MAEGFPEDWQRALVVVAHPDDVEYGCAAAVAAWTAAGRDVRYVMATSGEAGIAGLPPEAAGPLREREQRAAAAVVGVSVVEFLGHPDGRLTEGLDLRRAIAAAIRRHRPDLVVTLHFGDTWTPPGAALGSWNSADHRVLGRAVVDAVGDAANEWVFAELADPEPWRGVHWTAVSTPVGVTHTVDVTDVVDRAVASLAEHRRYLEALSAEPVEEQARRQVDVMTPDVDGRRVSGFVLYAG
ncbi:PIG-L deacetylase family protein [Geodermatophilus sp. SYSU D01036]